MNKSNETSNLRNLFDSGNRSFEIDEIQRPYDWKKPSVDSFLDFFKETFEASETHDLDRIIITKSGEVITIYDGQQRLASVQLLLLALAKRMRSIADDEGGDRRLVKLIEKIQDVLLLPTDSPSSKRRKRFSLRNENEDSQLEQLVYEVFPEEATRPKKLLSISDLSGQKLINSWSIIQDFSNQVEEDDLSLFITHIFNSVIDIINYQNDEEAARRKYYMLNSGGQKIDEFYSMKERLMVTYTEGDPKRTQIANNWETCENIMSNLSITSRDHLIKYVDIVKFNGQKSRYRKHSQYVGYIKKLGYEPSEYSELVKEEATKVESIANLLNPYTMLHSKTLKHASSLSNTFLPKTSFSQVLFVLLSSNKDNFDEVSRFSLYLNLYLRLTETDGSVHREVYQTCGERLRSGKPYRIKVMTPEELKFATRNKLDSSSLYKKTSRSLLIIVEEYLRRKKRLNGILDSFSASPDDYSIEHILPQSSHKEYKSLFGNMVVMPVNLNKEFGAKPYSAKRNKYNTSNMELGKLLYSTFQDFSEKDVPEWEDTLVGMLHEVFTKEIG